MALVFGAISPFADSFGTTLQAGSNQEEFDEQPAFGPDGKFVKICTSNPREVGTANGIVAVCAGEDGVDVDIDIGAKLGDYFISSVVLTQRNNSFPDIALSGTKYGSGVTVDEANAYTISLTGLKFGVQYIDAGVTSVTLADAQDCTVSYSVQINPQAANNIGTVTDTTALVYRMECSGTAHTKTTAAPAFAAGTQGAKGWNTTNQTYKVVTWRMTKYVNAA